MSMILRRTILKTFFLGIAAASAKAQSGLPDCGSGIPFNQQGMGIPNACAPGVPRPGITRADSSVVTADNTSITADYAR